MSEVGNGAVILTYPDAPVLLAEVIPSRTPTTITINWQEGAANGGYAVDGYRLWYDNALTDFIILEPNLNVLTYRAEDLTTGSTYKFKVQAYNSYGYSQFSNEVSILCAALPEQPLVPTSTVFENRVVFDWDTPADNGTPLTGYNIYFRKSDDQYETELVNCDGSNG